MLGSMAAEEKVTFCRICEPLCGMVATVEDGKLVKLRPDADNPLSKGYACPKGIAMAEVQNDPDRVTHPLKRNAAGEFERVSWDEALDDIGDRLGRILDERGPGAVAWYAGNPSAFSYSHALWRKGFLDCIGSPHAYGAGSQDVNNRFAASALMYGTPLVIPIPDIERTDFLFMVGANPLVSHGSVLSAPRVRERLLEIEERGGRVVCVDPRRSETAKQFEHQPIRPDGDAWLLLSMLHTIFDEGLADEGFLDTNTDGWAELRRFAAEHPPEATEAPDRDRSRAGARAGARLRGLGVRRGIRAHRRVPGPLRHARRLPARRAERRDGQRRPPGRQRLRRPADPARRDRRADRPRHLRGRPGALRRLPGRAGRNAGVAAAAGDHHAGRAPDPRAVRVRRATRCCRCRTATRWRRRSGSST